MAKAVVIAAPSSGSGKTVVTLALLRALARNGVPVASAKVGPDYIDPRFHAAATGRPCYNLDQWAMRPATVAGHMATLSRGADLIVIEGVMGLFDGPETGKGSTADLAISLGLPVILVVDCSHQAQSIAALVSGFAAFDGDLNLAGVILNRVSSPRHTELLTGALTRIGIEVVGAVPRVDNLALPSRHLGLVQAGEHPELDGFLDQAAGILEGAVDLDVLQNLAATAAGTPSSGSPLPPIGQRIAVADDEAFGFAYPHLLAGWRHAGAEVTPFSPLANEGPGDDADAVFLPGGYPELHGLQLSTNAGFLSGLRNAARRDALIYGECGGYMVLGDYIIDKDGERHAMAGLLPLGTSFQQRKLQLGYRHLKPHGPLPLAAELRGHEFHFSTVDWQGEAEALFEAADTAERPLGACGMRV
ncbi:MAG: cobyrinate a,c-diamide synthase, partial [Aestuariivirgaceae bacterium]